VKTSELDEWIKMNPLLKNSLMLLASYGVAFLVDNVLPTSKTNPPRQRPANIKKKVPKASTPGGIPVATPVDAQEAIPVATPVATPVVATAAEAENEPPARDSDLLLRLSGFSPNRKELNASATNDKKSRSWWNRSRTKGKEADATTNNTNSRSWWNRSRTKGKEADATTNNTNSRSWWNRSSNNGKAALTGSAVVGATTVAASRNNYNPSSWWNKPPTAEENLEGLRQHDTMMGMAGLTDKYDTTSAYSQHNQLALYTPPTLKDVGVDVGSFWGGKTRNHKKSMVKPKKKPTRKKQTRRRN
jgi:hypothetical protein